MRAFVPEIRKLPNRTVLTVTTVGNPNVVASKAIPALYTTAYQTKFKTFKPRKKVMVVGPLVARWPDAHRQPKAKWTGVWGLAVSDFVRTKDLVFKDKMLKPRLEKWPYGLTAQILHVGPYTTEGPTIKKLHTFIASQGYTLAGPHEEEYLTRPNVKQPKTIIRYRLRSAH